LNPVFSTSVAVLTPFFDFLITANTVSDAVTLTTFSAAGFLTATFFAGFD
jgi:hypothetical protein